MYGVGRDRKSRLSASHMLHVKTTAAIAASDWPLARPRDCEGCELTTVCLRSKEERLEIELSIP